MPPRGLRGVPLRRRSLDGGGGCTPWPYKGRVLGGIWTRRVGDDTFFTGEVEADVARLTVTYPDGEASAGFGCGKS
jgi:hypothetical protein